MELEVVKTKELKSTTAVQGILVQLSDKSWYAVTYFQPKRNPWFIRGQRSTTTGRIGENEVFMIKKKSKPTETDIQEAIKYLTNVLSGIEDPIHEKITYM